MNDIKDTQINAGPASTQARSAQKPQVRGIIGKGLLTAVGAAVVTTVVAALAKAAGVVFEIPDGGEAIPLSGIAFVTFVFSVVGVIIAVALLRWSAQPAKRWVQVAVSLTALSLVPPFTVGAAVPTAATLVALHLVAAAVMIPAVKRHLGK